MAVLLFWLDAADRALAAPSVPVEKPTAQRALERLLNERIAELAIPAKTVILPTDQALQTANEIKAGHYGAASRIAQAVLASSHQRGWRFYPFDEYMGSIVRGDDPALLRHLDRWLTLQPNSAVAHLIRAMFYAEAGWTARGGETANKVPDALMLAFTDAMTRSISDFRDAIRLDGSIPWSYLELERVSLHVGNQPIADQTFQTGSSITPSTRLSRLWVRNGCLPPMRTVNPIWMGVAETQ
jgi:hypothetical protein